MLVVAADAARGDRDVGEHGRVSADVGGMEERRVAGLADLFEVLGLLTGKQVRLRDGIVGPEKQTERDAGLLQGRCGFSQEQCGQWTGGDTRLPPFLVELEAGAFPSANNLRRPKCTRGIV